EATVPDLERIAEPVDLFEQDLPSIELLYRPDDDSPIVGPNVDDVERQWRPTRQAAPLADRVPSEAGVFADLVARRRENRAWAECRSIGGQMSLEHADIVVVRDETDLDRFGLVRGFEPERAGDCTRLRLGELAHRRPHPGWHRSGNAPEEIALVLRSV